jgi:hypothetical protein
MYNNTGYTHIMTSSKFTWVDEKCKLCTYSNSDVRTLTSRSVVRKHKKEVAQTLKPVYIYFENPER